MYKIRPLKSFDESPVEKSISPPVDSHKSINAKLLSFPMWTPRGWLESVLPSTTTLNPDVGVVVPIPTLPEL